MEFSRVGEPLLYNPASKSGTVSCSAARAQPSRLLRFLVSLCLGGEQGLAALTTKAPGHQESSPKDEDFKGIRGFRGWGDSFLLEISPSSRSPYLRSRTGAHS